MITNINIENFRSIRKMNTSLSQFTVLVGANGTGKSNIIKAVQFLSNIAKEGLENAVLTLGRFQNILPKAIPKHEIRNSKISLNYSMEIPYPDNYPQIHLPLNVNHQFVLSANKQGDPKINYEEIEFEKALIAAFALRSEDEIKDLSIPEEITDVSIKIRREMRTAEKIIFSSEIPSKYTNLIMEWFGLSEIFGKVKDKAELNKILNAFKKARMSSMRKDKSSRYPKLGSLIESGSSSLFFSSHARVFRGQLLDIKRYDFLQNELRGEQPASTSENLTFEGRNMPSVLKYLKNNKKEEWNRILDTIEELNPFIASASVSPLRTRKEFIHFTETNLHQTVESWDTSDGTLRALAILLALETHPNFGTLIIEEPEQNLHPWAIRILINHMRDVVKKRNIQIILTTHSQQVLENVHPEEVRVVFRGIENGTTLSSLDDIIPHHEIEMGEVGRLWVKGLLGGVPKYE